VVKFGNSKSVIDTQPLKQYDPAVTNFGVDICNNLGLFTPKQKSPADIKLGKTIVEMYVHSVLLSLPKTLYPA